ncbi:MAG: ISKra4 family transposase [Acetobacteraceae bacterium]
MRFRVLLEITTDDGTAGAAEEVAAFEKVTERPEDLGLSIAEGKALMAAVQHRTISAQAAAWSRRHRCCEACGARRPSKGSYSLVFMTLYGDVRLSSPRLHRCPCQSTDGPATVSPLRDLIPDHVAPERLYLEARWSSLAPYAAAAGLLADILPIASGANAKTLRMHALCVAERAEAELGEEQPCFIEGCPADWAGLPIPEGRIVVGLDGGYVRNWKDRKTNFEVIVGRSLSEDRDARYVGLVHGYDSKPKRRLFDMLKSQGLQANQDVTFLTDGGEEVRALTELVTPESEHVLDWFHIAMRLTVLEQYARGVAHHDEAAGERLVAALEQIKWLLWHGNQHRSQEALAFLEDDVDGLEVDYPNLRKFVRTAHEFAVYITTNTASLINYGERFRAGERISSCLAESTVNAVISKRFAKRQQMQWTKRGAHLLLQTRTRTLDGTLRPLFERWYPGLANDNTAPNAQAVAA